MLLQKNNNIFSEREISSLFKSDENRAEKYSINVGDIFFDYSKNLFIDSEFAELIDWAKEGQLEKSIHDLFAGKVVNNTESQPALHTLLRNNEEQLFALLDDKIANQIIQAREQMFLLADKIRCGEYHGFSGKPINTVVNIGIGGSDLGPFFLKQALVGFASSDIQVFFISNLDVSPLLSLLENIDPEQTIFCITSKSFKTEETLANASIAKEWYLEATGNKLLTNHFFAVTNNQQLAELFGVNSTHIFPMWEWLGGRYSVWSAVGFSVACAIGSEHFKQFLSGAKFMDEHFINAPFEKNLPVLLALVHIWNKNVLGLNSRAVIAYDERLRYFVNYLQQLEMESNGKSVAKNNNLVDYSTAGIIWGGVGTNVQHAFFQALHQGTEKTLVDFIGVIKPRHQLKKHHSQLLLNLIAQSLALMEGSNILQRDLPLHQYCRGNCPNNVLLVKELTPNALGQLIALYEHKVFVQGVLWDINSFDQYGVELGKELAIKLAEDGFKNNKVTFDASTENLLNKIK